MSLFTQPTRLVRRPQRDRRITRATVVETSLRASLMCPCCLVTFGFGNDCPVCDEALIEAAAYEPRAAACRCDRPRSRLLVAVQHGLDWLSNAYLFGLLMLASTGLLVALFVAMLARMRLL